MKTITESELKREGVAAIESGLKEGDAVVILTDSGRQYAVMSAERYELLKDYEWEQETLEALADCEAGRTVDGETVLKWMESWGEEDEQEPPF